jgi:FixJ family two-component response regulator
VCRQLIVSSPACALRDDLGERGQAEHRELGEREERFTNVSAPVMTRLRQPERQILDLLVEGGVARSRSDALGWCVRLVQRHTDEWLGELRDSLANVQQVRAQGSG